MRRLPLTVLVALALPLLARADSLVEAPGVEWVRGHCAACHSLDLVTSQRGDKAYWLETIRWMQATQNLWAIPEEQEAAILDYLSTNYIERDWGRRPNLPVGLRPVKKAIAVQPY